VNESFYQTEKDSLLLKGMKVGHSTLQRQVHTSTEYLEFPDSPIAVNEVCLDGGKVRLRTQTPGQKCEWRDAAHSRRPPLGGYEALLRQQQDCRECIMEQRSVKKKS